MSVYHSKNAIVFGGAGFVGRHLIRRLARDNWTVSVVTRRPHRHRDLLVMPTVKLIESEWPDPEFIDSLLGKNDTVINLVGILNESKQQTFESSHVTLPETLARVGLEKNIRRLIHMSSLGADVNGPSRYLQSKGRGEQVVLEAGKRGLEFEILRPSIVFGPDDSFTCLFATLLKLSKGVFCVISPQSQMQPVYIGDLVNCIMHAVEQQSCTGGSFDIAGPEIFSFCELIQLIDSMSGGRHRLIPLNDFFTKLVATFMQFTPGKLITPDNVRSLQVPNIIQTAQPEPYGVQSRQFEETAATWLRPQTRELDTYRAQAGR